MPNTPPSSATTGAPESPRARVYGRRKPLERRHLYFVVDWPDKWIGRPTRDGYRFDLEKDPRELNAQPGTGMPESLSAVLERARESGGLREGEVDPDPGVRDALRALGYVAD